MNNFVLLTDFPESLPAIEDLKFCLDRTSQRQQLLTSLKSAFETRLLHPGKINELKIEWINSVAFRALYLYKIVLYCWYSFHSYLRKYISRLISNSTCIILYIFCPLNVFVISSGVHTSDIITVYISAIKALRHLDPSMVILQVACQPIRKYLRLA